MKFLKQLAIAMILLLVASLMPVPVLAAVPVAPTNLAATPSATLVYLTWDDNSNDETGFRVERAGDAAFTLSTPFPVGAGVRFYSDETVSSNTVYYYRVFAKNVDGDSAPSNVVMVLTVTPPAAPDTLVASAVNAYQVNLTWIDNASDETNFRVERATNVGFSENLVQVTLGVNIVAYSDSTVSPSTTYFYRVFAFNAGGDSDPSNVAEVTTPVLPAAPTNLAATAINHARVDLTWLDNATTETGYRVERAEDVGFSDELVTVTLPVNSQSYSDTAVSGSTTYYYRVFAFNVNGNSAASNIEEVTTPSSPGAPTNLAATEVSYDHVNLTWTDNATTETGFRIERATDDAFTLNRTNFTVGAGVTAYSNITVAPGIIYYYRVFAFDADGDSEESNTVMVTTLITPVGAPGGLVATAVSSTQINLTWVDNATAETGFRIERATDAAFTLNRTNFTVNVIDTVAYSDIAVAPGTVYYYRVFAFDADVDSEASNTVMVTTPVAPPAAPSGLVATAVSTTQINLTWVDNATTETGFRVERAPDAAGVPGVWAQIGTTAVNVTTYSDTAAAPSTTYYYRIVAYNASGNSTPTATATATTQSPPPPPAPAGGGGDAGGGGMAPVYTITTTGLETSTIIKLDAAGVLQSPIEYATPDGVITLSIPAGTKMMNGAGNPLNNLWAMKMDSPPSAPPANAIVTAYEFGPAGAKFDPAITMTFKFDPGTLPAEVDINHLFIAFWNGKEWEKLECTVDLVNNTVSAKVEHFSVFALFATLPAKVVPVSIAISPKVSNSGDTVKVSLICMNTGGESGEQTMVLKINGVEEGKKTVTIASGASQAINFDVKKSTGGTYTVDAGGLSDWFTVLEAPKVSAPPEPVPSPVVKSVPETPEATPPALPASTFPFVGGVLGAVAVAVLVIALVMWRRRG